ncbi:E3 ubiquitin-protein ligase PRT1-like [Pyrus communis]|uniref:E3 ubiquitin-protein ligase PRT1-like n=1 Tax=Pyrus communis TaxID=23211 RepID=UPI0035C2026B
MDESVHRMMEIADGGVQPEEEVSDSFLCCVCRDLLHKPIVLSCGHISCFWCVHRSMSRERQSYCLLCRHPYNYFPTICQMLHFLLLKKYPVAYRRRELQILEEEKILGSFSPQFDTHSSSSEASQCSNVLANSACRRCCENVKKIESSPRIQNSTNVPKEAHCGVCEGIGNVADEEKNSLLNMDCGSRIRISVADVLCAACEQLLFHPVVLNCGHVYCESCIVNPDEQMLTCKVCQSCHPSEFPKVCLELGCFLEEQFPKEYALRRDAVQFKQADLTHENRAGCTTKDGNKGEKLSWWSDPNSEIHPGCGCDSCGMYPIIGDRYKCIDCTEKMGFDLCSHCYNTRSKLPGRFNQQHTPEHRLEHVRIESIRNQLKLVTGRLDDRSLALLISNITSQASSEGLISAALSTVAQEEAENRLAAQAAVTNTGDEQDDSQPTLSFENQ